MARKDSQLNAADIAYVADMLRAIVWVKDELPLMSPTSFDQHLEILNLAEASLRQIAMEIDIATKH